VIWELTVDDDFRDKMRLAFEIILAEDLGSGEIPEFDEPEKVHQDESTGLRGHA
jgi:hypothetical protein